MPSVRLADKHEYYPEKLFRRIYRPTNAFGNRKIKRTRPGNGMATLGIGNIRGTVRNSRVWTERINNNNDSEKKKKNEFRRSFVQYFGDTISIVDRLQYRIRPASRRVCHDANKPKNINKRSGYDHTVYSGAPLSFKLARVRVRFYNNIVSIMTGTGDPVSSKNDWNTT